MKNRIADYEPAAKKWIRARTLKPSAKQWRKEIAGLNVPDEVRNATDAYVIGCFLMEASLLLDVDHRRFLPWCEQNISDWGLYP